MRHRKYRVIVLPVDEVEVQLNLESETGWVFEAVLSSAAIGSKVTILLREL